jgi:hypothetical protein
VSRAGAVDVVAQHQHEREGEAGAPRDHLVGDVLLPAVAAAGVADDGEADRSLAQRQRERARGRVQLAHAGGGRAADLWRELRPAEAGGQTQREQHRDDHRRQGGEEDPAERHAPGVTDPSGFHASATN